MIMIASALTIECTSQRSAVPSILALISDSWAEFPELRHRRTELVLGSYENDVLVAFGGYQGGHLNSVEVFDGETRDRFYLRNGTQNTQYAQCVVNISELDK